MPIPFQFPPPPPETLATQISPRQSKTRDSFRAFFEPLGGGREILNFTHFAFLSVKRLAAKITPKSAHLITLSDEKSGTMLLKALKTGFGENRGQSGPLSVDSKTKGKCQ